MTTILQRRLEVFFKRNHERINRTELTVCMGNEGMDLDSFISSLIVAFAEDIIHVVNMRKSVFEAKGDLIALCEMFGINTNDLIFLERPNDSGELPNHQVGTHLRAGNSTIPVREKNLKLVLTDHNTPVFELQKSDVVMVIDHHALENALHSAKTIYVDIDVGSATTLVARYLGEDLSRKHHCLVDPRNTDPDKVTLCESISKMLLIPIIMDTSHLRRRTSIFDHFEYKRLKAKANIKKKELKVIRRTLKAARLNDDKIPSDIILQKDFKKYNHNAITFGIATVKYSYENWVDREARETTGIPEDKKGIVLWMKLNDFRTSFGLDFLVVNCKLKGERQLLIVNFPLIELFAQQNMFEKREYKGIDFYKVKLELSRKLITPKIHHFLKNISLRY